jgi:hypothetical protein
MLKEVQGEVIETTIHPVVKPMSTGRKFFGYISCIILIPGLFAAMLATYGIKVADNPILFFAALLPVIVAVNVFHTIYYRNR